MKKSLKITLGVIGGILLLFIIDLICIFAINRPLFAIKQDNGSVYRGIFYDTYNCQEYSLPQIKAKGLKFTCADSKNNTSSKKENNDEHSFFGKVIESHSTYIIVKPNEDEEERKSSDKFRIELKENSDVIYNIGTNVKITYVGYINESYPAQIGATKIEIKSTEDFDLVFNKKTGDVKKQIVDKNTNKQYNYNVYVWNGDVQIIIDNKTYSLEEALNENKITMDEIITKANRDMPNVPSYDDGGSIEYHYDNYTIIKFHTIDGNRDVYIGNEKLTIHDVK